MNNFTKEKLTNEKINELFARQSVHGHLLELILAVQFVHSADSLAEWEKFKTAWLEKIYSGENQQSIGFDSGKTSVFQKQAEKVAEHLLNKTELRLIGMLELQRQADTSETKK